MSRTHPCRRWFSFAATKVSSWTRAPLAPFAETMVRIWLFGGQAVRAIGNLIPEKLNAGPDPSAPFSIGRQ